MLEKVKVVVYLLFAYLGVEVETFVILMTFMSVDSFMGGIKAVRLGDRFSFSKMLWGITLKLCFLVVPLIIALLGKSVGYDFHAGVNVTISILTVAEAYSIIGNIYSAKNRSQVNRVDVVSLMLINLRKVLKKTLEGLLGKISQIK
jgi:phage-related holin